MFSLFHGRLLAALCITTQGLLLVLETAHELRTPCHSFTAQTRQATPYNQSLTRPLRNPFPNFKSAKHNLVQEDTPRNLLFLTVLDTVQVYKPFFPSRQASLAYRFQRSYIISEKRAATRERVGACVRGATTPPRNYRYQTTTTTATLNSVTR